jgi:hypothetical protein
LDLQFVAAALGLPALAVVVMTALEALIDTTVQWRARVAKLGWDLCVLAIGGTGGVFATASLVTTDRTHSSSLLWEGVAFFVTLGAAIGIMFVRRGQSLTGKKAWLALAIGGAALAVPVALASLL